MSRKKVPEVRRTVQGECLGYRAAPIAPREEAGEGLGAAHWPPFSLRRKKLAYDMEAVEAVRARYRPKRNGAQATLSCRHDAHHPGPTACPV
jgi:hypothetical protein